MPDLWHGVIRRWNATGAGSARGRKLPPKLARHVPEGASILDVGCGDGRIAAEVARLGRASGIRGVDTVAQPASHIPTTLYDGQNLPFPDGSFDLVSLVDVLHHTRAPLRLLQEAARVSRGRILIKDHDWTRWHERSLLVVADYLGNRPYGVDLPYAYLRPEEWDALFSMLPAEVEQADRFTYGGGDLCRQVIFVLRLGDGPVAGP